jgi:hypothetical protein
MNDVVQGALIGASSALGGVLISQMGSLVIERRRELASYRVNLYAKRLEVHQEAFGLVQRLGAMADYVSFKANDGVKSDLVREVEGAQKWWSGNCLYLDAASNREIAIVMGLCFRLATGALSEVPSERIDHALGVVAAGVGSKHIDIVESQNELRTLRRSRYGP